MATLNSTILEKVWLAGTNDFQQRIPEPTQQNIASTIDALFAPMNRQYFNQFMDILINRIAFTYVRGEAWRNKLAVFKGQKLNYGQTIQEIAPKWIKAHSYLDDSETLLKMHRPEAQAWYHSQNRRDRYPITVNYDELRTAFVDEYGINNLIAKIMQVPMNSDEYDEYRIMLQLIAEYENRWGFFKHQLSAVPTDEDTGKEFLTAIQTYAGMLQFPSTLYNAQNITDIPVFAGENELVLFVTPATNASVNVNTLSILFNMDVADVKIRKIIVDEFPVPGMVALLTTEDFFVCNDTNYQNTSFYNPETLNTTYWLHHWGVYSVSPFVPAICFTINDGTETGTITQSVSGVSMSVSPDTIAAGETTEITVELTGTITDNDGGITVKPDAVIYELSASLTTDEGEDTEETVPIQLSMFTYVDNYNILHTQSDLESGTEITVTGTTIYINPSGETTKYTDSVTVTIS